MKRSVRRSAAVTGAGSGLGRDIALGLAVRQYRVFGTAMEPNEIADLEDASGGAVTLSRCDITDEAAVQEWARQVVSETGGGLDLFISNAGTLTPGPLEGLPLAAIRRGFEVNVFGALSVINAFLPALRQSRGRIVQISTGTTMPLPFNGTSGASKAVMDVFDTLYRAELKSFGIDVVGWLDVVNVPVGGSVDLVVDFTDPVIRGTSVFHCHLLNHEDQEMMAKILFE